MPIAKTTGYRDSAGELHATVEEAQRAELIALLNTVDGTGLFVKDDADKAIALMAEDLVKHRDELLTILTLTPTSRPKARKSAGTSNPRRAAKRATPQQAQQGFEDMRQAANGTPDNETPTTADVGEV